MKKILIVLLILIFIYCIGGVVYSLNIKEEKPEEVVLNINQYDYKINDSVNDLYKNEFKKLKTNLESENKNIDEYIKSIAKVYIIDLYSLNDKYNKYDVTASQYVKESSRENFKLKVSETIYKFIEDKRDGVREQELPNVSEIIVDSINETVYTIDENEYKAYDVVLSWKYDKELGYPISAIVTLIEDNNIVSVVSEKRMEVEQ